MLNKRFFKTKEEVEVTFEVDRPAVENIDIAGDWNGWSLEPMRRARSGKGPFRFKVRLPRDREFEFRYLFDGRAWENDEAADGYRPNAHGSDNSLVVTRG